MKPAVSPRGRPRDPERMRRVLQSAARQFCELGFERTSVEAVAQASGVSKVTIYSYFPTKQLLFEAVVEQYTDTVFAALPPELLDPRHPETALSRIAAQFLTLFRSYDVIG
ncbi:MAG: TetR/AcrR family transcriptional regulator, partial [Magnetococcales bacterium]|nr:TetR/AcrR family transcriptional regulator [Magnetococcales bacterium]